MLWNVIARLQSGEAVGLDVRALLEAPVNGSVIHVPLQHCYLNGEALLERPCDLKLGFSTLGRLSMGAFSYSFSHISVNVAEIGRYCSIAGEVMFGQREHPTAWLSTSGFQYEADFMRAYMPAITDVGFKSIDLPAEKKRTSIVIGNDVWIGSRSYIKAGVVIGDGAIIGTNAVVTKDVPPYAIVGGNPARIIRYRFPPAIVTRLLELRWWQYAFTDFDDFDPGDIDGALDRIERLVAGGMQPYAPPVTRIVGDGARVSFAAVVAPEPEPAPAPTKPARAKRVRTATGGARRVRKRDAVS